MHCCKGCKTRYLGCHGKDEEGNWRCKEWAKQQEKQDAGKQNKEKANIFYGYARDVGYAKERRKKSHHSGRW